MVKKLALYFLASSIQILKSCMFFANLLEVTCSRAIASNKQRSDTAFSITDKALAIRTTYYAFCTCNKSQEALNL